MEALNYRPNTMARGLVTRRSRRIGVISFDSRMFGPGSTLRAIERAARDQGYGMAVAGMSGSAARDVRDAAEALEAQSVDGMIVIAPHASAAHALASFDSAAPMVAVESRYRDDLPVVTVDQFAGAALAVQHLLALGHDTVFHVGGPADWREAELRVEGWRGTLADAGRRTPPLVRGDWSPRSGYDLGLQIADEPSLTAVFAANDQMALGVMHALHSRGRRIPDDVSVVGFDDMPESEFMLPALTTVHQDFDSVGRRGLELLIDLLDGPGALFVDGHDDRRQREDGSARAAGAEVTIAPTLVARASTGPPASGTTGTAPSQRTARPRGRARQARATQTRSRRTP